MLDLNEVALFVEVVRAGSFAGAGRRLGMPANSVSRHVQQLEAQLGSRLLQRSTRRLSLTAAGQIFFDRCAGAVADLSQAGQDMIDGSRQPSGLIRIAAPAGFLDLFAIDWVVQFLDAYPQVRLEFVLSDARADLIAEGIDVAFRAGIAHDSGSASRRLLPQQFILVASPAYTARRGLPRRLAEVARHDCIGLVTAPGPLSWHMDGGEEVLIAARFCANTAGAVLRAALAGLGIAMLPRAVADAELRAGRLVRVLPQLQRSGSDLCAVFPSPQQIPRAVSAFVDWAARHLAMRGELGDNGKAVAL